MTSLLLLLACSSSAPEATPPAVTPPAETPAEVAPAAEPEVPAEVAPSDGAAEVVDPDPAPDAPPAGHSEHAEHKAEAPQAEEPTVTEEAATEAPSEPEPQATEEPPPEPAGPVTYTLDAGRSRLVVLIDKDPDTMGAGLSHDHVVQAKGWRGTVTWDEADLAACRIQFSLPVAKLDPDSPSLRKAYGLEGELSSGQRQDVKDNMLAKDQLDAGRFPDITFQSTGCSGAADKPTVKGTLTIHGTGKAISVPMTVAVEGDTFSATGSFTAKHTDFGMEPFSAMFGQLKNKNALRFRIKVQGRAE